MKKGIDQYKVGDRFEGFMLIKEVTKGIASNGKPFLTIILIDKTGEIDAKLWGATEEDEALYVAERIVNITGEITEFRGSRQFKIITIRQANQIDGVHITQFIKTAPVKKEVLIEKITAAIFEMSNPTIQRIVRTFVSKYQEELLTYPAASRNHHEYASGLAHHVVSMLDIAKKLVELYPQLNKDLLYAGVILHDLGKIKELSGVGTTTYTLEGKLLGHIPIMIDEIGHVAKELKIEGEEVLVLQHLVLSHHGKAEWGSPTPPLVQEAEILHLIDLIDAKLNMLDRALANVKPGDFTERLFAMDNRMFYKPKFEKE